MGVDKPAGIAAADAVDSHEGIASVIRNTLTQCCDSLSGRVGFGFYVGTIELNHIMPSGLSDAFDSISAFRMSPVEFLAGLSWNIKKNSTATTRAYAANMSHDVLHPSIRASPAAAS